MGAPENGLSSRIALRGRERRPLEDRLAVRFPPLAQRLAAWLTPVALRLPHHWRLRRLLIVWAYWRGTNALRRGDLDLLRVISHRDCIWDQTHFEGWPHTQVYRGHQGLAAFVAEWGNAWEGGGGWPDAFGVEEFEGGVFLTDGRLRGVGRGSGVAVEVDVCNVIEMRDGLFWRVENFTDRAQAIEAARARSRQAT